MTPRTYIFALLVALCCGCVKGDVEITWREWSTNAP